MFRKIIIIIILLVVAGSGYWAYRLTRSERLYKNEKYGYEVEYPRGWNIDSLMSEEVIFTPAKNSTDRDVHIIIRNNPYGLSVKEWIEANPFLEIAKQSYTKEELLTIKGNPAIKYNDGSGGAEVFISKGKIIYQISSLRYDSETLNQILSNIKFLD